MTIQFAFYGRVSTDEHQDPVTSRQWQRDCVDRLIEGRGVVVSEYFDVDKSRSLPWHRRPEASRLLADVELADRPFDAVVVAEAPRAFFGNQWSDVLPRLDYFDVAFWLPEMGGPVDLTSDAHEMQMSLFGGMSKGERRRIQARVKAGMSVQARHQGRYLGGRPPYGFRLGDAGPHPNASKAASGLRLRVLEPDPVTGPVVERIFRERLAGAGLASIANGLTADRVPTPSEADPDRNRGRQPSHGAWAKATVRTILQNRKYTGFVVWNKQGRTEKLLNPRNPSDGYRRGMSWNDPTQWITSQEPSHTALISVDDFEQAQLGFTRRQGKRRPSDHSYALRGILVCGSCGRRMAGNMNHGRPHYRCKVRTDLADQPSLDHPKTVYVREDQVLPSLAEWLQGVFGPDRLDLTCELLLATVTTDPSTEARHQAIRNRLAAAQGRIARCEEMLGAGADVATVSNWLNQAVAEKRAVERELSAGPIQPQVTADQIRRTLSEIRDPAAVFLDRDPEVLNRYLVELGIKLEYCPERKQLTAESRPLGPCAVDGVEGGT